MRTVMISLAAILVVLAPVRASSSRPFSVVEFGPGSDRGGAATPDDGFVTAGGRPMPTPARTLGIPGTIAVTSDGAVWVDATLSWHARIVRIAPGGDRRADHEYGLPIDPPSAGTYAFVDPPAFGFRTAFAVAGTHLLVEPSASVIPPGAVFDLAPDGSVHRRASSGCLAAGPDLLCDLPPRQVASCAEKATSAVRAPDGSVWFTDPKRSRIGRLTPAGSCRYFSRGLVRSASGPELITRGPDGNFWFTEVHDRIGRITPAGVITTFSIAAHDRPFLGGIAPGPDGALWFTVYHGNDLGRITTTGHWRIYRGVTFPSRDVDDNPVSLLARGPDGRLYENLSEAGRFAQITIETSPVAVVAARRRGRQ